MLDYHCVINCTHRNQKWALKKKILSFLPSFDKIYFPRIHNHVRTKVYETHDMTSHTGTLITETTSSYITILSSCWVTDDAQVDESHAVISQTYMNWFICPHGGSEVSWKHKISSSSLVPDRKVSRDWTHDSGSPGEQKSLFCQLCCDGHLLQNINLNLSLNRAHINEADGRRSEDKRVIFSHWCVQI